MEFPILETDLLKLIEITEVHINDVFSIFSDERVTKYYGMAQFTGINQAMNLVNSFQKNFQEKRSIRWGITLKDTEVFVGTIGLNNLQITSKKTEIGYDLKPDYWRRGIISEAAQTVIKYCFEKLDLYRIGAITFPENEPSFKLLLNLGFQKEGLLRGYIYQNDKSNDAYIFSIVRPDWKDQ
ncbi:GNAT family N-acetyltransferase [Psychrobacillus lasiicapitis]|uniref:GNAT family N-acetyltransferase n=1 Tax=Psychrobacillus lasiicapitis TaxID=1636719 RepID=A0A544TGY7_9BACI|nr:GNAT family protein [Psychrobacillus lasiicapitis]TQR16697.1 GNAT family N-acetyltransferase [Psychrobacillus lasiicapitis]GGA27971.1 N-acetyltransferase [Psychrobacillus lasiicapitis]